MQPTRMAFVAVGTTLAFLAALVWGGAYFASAGPSASELPHASITLPLVAATHSLADLSTDTDFAIHTAQVPTDASAGATTTTTDATATDAGPTSAAQNVVGTSGDQVSSRTNTTGTTAVTSVLTQTTLVPISTTLRTTLTTLRTGTTRVATATTTAPVRVSSNTTQPYFQTSLPLGDDRSTDREVVRPRLREDSDD